VLIAPGPDGALWFTEYYGNQIARAPECALGLSASYASGALTANFELGIDRGAVWSLSAGPAFGFQKPIPAVVPPAPFSFSQSYPNSGEVEVKSSLLDQSGAALCSEWTTVNTAP
jgi:hypothetical protein